MKTATKLKAFHGAPAIKAKYADRLSEHRRLEHLIQGVGFEKNGTTKGCAVGCTLEVYDHELYPTELGLPVWLARLEDAIFEKLPKGGAEQFAVDFLNVIPVGANVEPVLHKLAILRIDRNLKLLEGNKEPYALECRNAINAVAAWHQMEISGERSAARSAAESAAQSAAWSAESAARSAAESAARSAAGSAAWSARSAAESAARSAAESAAWSARSAARSAAWSAESAAWSSARSARSAAWSAAESARSAAESAAESAESAESAAWEQEASDLLKLLSEAQP